METHPFEGFRPVSADLRMTMEMTRGADSERTARLTDTDTSAERRYEILSTPVDTDEKLATRGAG